jgi:hypothetical protein
MAIAGLDKIFEGLRELIPSQYEGLGGILATFAVAAPPALFWVAKRAHGFYRSKRDIKLAAAQDRMDYAPSFTEAEFAGARRHFVSGHCSNLDPSSELHLRAAVGVREEILPALNRELSSPSGSRHILILADSGMGKTTLLLNLFVQELGKPEAQRRPMALIAFARGDPLKKIAAARRPSNTILLLDALDEDPAADGDHKRRLAEVMRAAEDFKAVLITCRTQFFSKDEEIPVETGIAVIGARPAGVERIYKFRKLYLLPLNDEQIAEYVRRAIGIWRFRTRRLAMTLVKTLDELSMRPMLLKHIPDIARSGKRVHEMSELYEFMVNEWLKRESEWISQVQLMTMSQLLAIELFANRRERQGELIDKSRMAQFLSKHNFRVKQGMFEHRSLLNRDADGNYKFSHRSILEYLLVRAAVDGNKDVLQFEWTALMSQMLLSWGRATAGTADGMKRASALFSSDLTSTHLVPFGKPRQWDAKEIDEDRCDVAFSWAIPYCVREGLPDGWLGLGLRILRKQWLVRVYEIFDGSVFTTVSSESAAGLQGSSLQRTYAEERHRWRINLGKLRAWMLAHPSESCVTLFDFHALSMNLASRGLLFNVLREGEIYWLKERSSARTFFARVVREGSTVNYLDSSLVMFATRAMTTSHEKYTLEVYSALRNGATRAVLITVLRGTAEGIYQHERTTGDGFDMFESLPAIEEIERTSTTSSRNSESPYKWD